MPHGFTSFDMKVILLCDKKKVLNV